MKMIRATVFLLLLCSYLHISASSSTSDVTVSAPGYDHNTFVETIKRGGIGGGGGRGGGRGGFSSGGRGSGKGGRGSRGSDESPGAGSGSSAGHTVPGKGAAGRHSKGNASRVTHNPLKTSFAAVMMVVTFLVLGF